MSPAWEVGDRFVDDGLIGTVDSIVEAGVWVILDCLFPKFPIVVPHWHAAELDRACAQCDEREAMDDDRGSLCGDCIERNYEADQ